MPDTAMRDHLRNVALLPDYVLGKLDETSLRRVSRHVDACSICRRELDNVMDVLGVLANVPPPPAWIRNAILEHAVAENPAVAPHSATPGSVFTSPNAAGGIGVGLDSKKGRQRHMLFAQPVQRWMLVAASAAVFLIGGLVSWSDEQRSGAIQDERVSALMNDPAAAYPLDESDFPVAAAGVVFAEPKGREVYLVANGLPVLPHDQRYQVWLFTTENTQESAGLLTAEDDGNLRALLQTPAPFANYVAVALTAEPETGSAMPTSEEVLGGAFSPVIAALPSLPAKRIPIAGNH